MASRERQKLEEDIARLEQQLEAQAAELKHRNRELEIEAALDKVRVRATAMRSSSELAETSAVLFHQLSELNIKTIRTGVGIFDDANSAMELWLTSFSDNQEVVRILDYFSLYVHPVFENIIPARQQQKPYALTVLQGSEVRDYYQIMSTYVSVPKQQQYNATEYFYSFFFSGGTINVITDHSLSEDECNILIRFAMVFGLIYTRFLDLQNAEAAKREAQIETALERVRAKAQAMQQPEELKEVVQVLRYEMGVLDVEELETCTLFIHDPDAPKAECWFAIKDAKENQGGIATDHIELDLLETWAGREMHQFYESEEKQTSIVMTGSHRREWIQYCMERSPVLRSFFDGEIPDRALHLQKFSNGTVGITSSGVISGESWDLLKRAASVFSLAYSRFKDLTQARIDLQHLKEEKSRAESALTELRATQTQLIHSEKMASLGELTAGIAHEIQNPLNFINNFSEVNTELIEEMKEELLSGKVEEVVRLAEDVKQNNEKIIFHGKRADSIVKSMLQHSRNSSGQKDLTDINVLADECLRLSYHGMRAKDKTFNVKTEISLDPSLPKVPVVSQDIGRVLLNLLTNAFYAVNEKKAVSTVDYEPVVTVTSKTIISPKGEPAGVEIRIRDNGRGIPQKVLEKIFQPFFTTKPTGVGTGLGLSLSYDIITKGHGGELKVETKEGEFAEFIIKLPS